MMKPLPPGASDAEFKAWCDDVQAQSRAAVDGYASFPAEAWEAFRTPLPSTPTRWRDRLPPEWRFYVVSGVFLGGAALAFLLGGVPGLESWFSLSVAFLFVFSLGYGLVRLCDTPQAEAPADNFPQRGSGVYGGGGFAYWYEVEEPRFAVWPTTPTQWSKAIYLQRLVHMYDTVPQTPSVGYCGYHGEAHGVTIAPTRSGKGTAAIIPTLLRTRENVFVLDLKGENYFVTHKQREAMGHSCYLINPWNIWGKELGYAKPLTVRFNPLAELRPDRPGFDDAINGLAAAMILDQGTDPHWSESARLLVACLMAYLCSDPGELAAGHNTLPYMRQLLGADINVLAGYLTTAIERSPLAFVRDNAGVFATPSKENASIRSSAANQTAFLTNPAIAHFLSGSDFDFSLLRRPNTSVYFIIPPEQLSTNPRFARLMVQSVMGAVWRTPTPDDESVLLILDEQYQLGKMKILSDAVSILSGYRCRIWSIFQDLSQIEDSSGIAWQTMVANAGFIQIMGCNDMKTAQEFSTRVGKTTTVIHNLSGGTSSTANEHGGSSGSSSGWSQSPVAVDAVSPQDLLGWRRDRALLFVKGLQYPAVTTRTNYWEADPRVIRRDSFLPNPMRQEDHARALAQGKAWHKLRTQAQLMEIFRTGGKA